MTDKYILVYRRPVKEPDLITWARWFETADRQVARDEIGDVRVSTVFLGLNHRFGSGPPLLFETMIFGGVHDGYQERSSTWKEAEVMHKTACDLARNGLWTSWFAWRPVTLLTLEIAWLRWVLRRPREPGPESAWSRGRWEYANPHWWVELADQ